MTKYQPGDTIRMFTAPRRGGVGEPYERTIARVVDGFYGSIYRYTNGGQDAAADVDAFAEPVALVQRPA